MTFLQGVGIFMIVIVLVAILAFAIKTLGWKTGVLTFLGALALCGFIGVAGMLINGIIK